MNLLTVGLIGVANFGEYRRKQMKASGRFNLVALCDRNAVALATAAAEEKAQPYSDFDQMLDHPGLEAIVISTGAESQIGRAHV